MGQTDKPHGAVSFAASPGNQIRSAQKRAGIGREAIAASFLLSMRSESRLWPDISLRELACIARDCGFFVICTASCRSIFFVAAPANTLMCETDLVINHGLLTERRSSTKVRRMDIEGKLRSAAQSLSNAEGILRKAADAYPFWTALAAPSSAWQRRRTGPCELGYWES